MQKTVLSLAACVLALAAAGVHAQALWKWRDASGQLHISDKAPPPGTPAKDILAAPPGGVLPPPSALVPKPASAPADTTPATASESALDKKKKAADKEKDERDKADRAAAEAKNAAPRRDNCARAQNTLQALNSGQRVTRMNDKGEREFLDDAGRAAETKHAQDAVATSCGPAPAAQ